MFDLPPWVLKILNFAYLYTNTIFLLSTIRIDIYLFVLENRIDIDLKSP